LAQSRIGQNSSAVGTEFEIAANQKIEGWDEKILEEHWHRDTKQSTNDAGKGLMIDNDVKESLRKHDYHGDYRTIVLNIIFISPIHLYKSTLYHDNKNHV
jgi:hypothetical protein